MDKILLFVGRAAVVIGAVFLLFLPFIIRQGRVNSFAWKTRFLSYDNKPPRYRGKKKYNQYLRRLRFHSKIPLEDWQKNKPTLEVFFKKKIYAIKEGKNVRDTDIFLIQEQLPRVIPWNDSYMEEGRRFSIGEGYMGKVVWDVTKLPHGLIAGASGGGKTTILRCIVKQAIAKKWNLTIFDFKGGGDFNDVEKERAKYQDLEAGYGSLIVSDPEEARQLLLGLSIEAKGRLEKFKEVGVRDIDEYNASGKGFFVPWLVVVDEAAEILDVKPTDKAEKELYTEIDQTLRTLARTSRAAGITLLLGFIRPSADVLDGQIKNNLLFRCCGYFSDPGASRIVLDNDRATELPPEIKGRFIVGEDETQAYYLPTTPRDAREGMPTPPHTGGAGGEAEREPADPPAAAGGLT